MRCGQHVQFSLVNLGGTLDQIRKKHAGVVLCPLQDRHIPLK